MNRGKLLSHGCYGLPRWHFDCGKLLSLECRVLAAVVSLSLAMEVGRFGGLEKHHMEARKWWKIDRGGAMSIWVENRWKRHRKTIGIAGSEVRSCSG